MDGTIQRLPFLDLQQHVTRHVGDGPGQHGGIKHPPGNDAVERQTALQALGGPKLPVFEATGPLGKIRCHTSMPQRTGGPLDALDGVRDRVHRDRGRPQPLDRLHLCRGLAFPDLHSPQSHLGQALALAMPGWTAASRDKTAAPAWLLGPAARHAGAPASGAAPARVGPPRWPTQTRSGALTQRSHAARITSSTPSGRSAASRS